MTLRWCILLLCVLAKVSSSSGASVNQLIQHPIKAPAEITTDDDYYYYPATVQEHLPGAHEISPREKQQAVKDAFTFAWGGYKFFSWGSDENRPVTSSPVNTRNGWAASLVDGLDTLYIMGLYNEFREARDFVAKIDWTKTRGSSLVQVFETTIRYVGGLLSAYELSGDVVFINKTVELVDKLLPAFDTPTGIPYRYVDFSTGKGVKSGFPDGTSCLAELGTVQLEFTRLSEITGDWRYHYIGQRVYDAFFEMEMDPPGLYPHLINADTGEPYGSYITWGGMADSFYEYLIKQYVMSSRQDEEKKEMVIAAVRSLEKHLQSRPRDRPDIAFLANLNNNEKIPVMDELACFAPGNLLLAARTIPELAYVEDLAFDLMHGCYNAWISTRTGLAPEVFGWVDEHGHSTLGNLTDREKFQSKKYGAIPIIHNYILRPETLESLYYFYRFTHDRRYQDMAWEIFDAIHTYCRANSGFSGVADVDSFYPRWDDRQESFLFAETLKYLYLIYDESKEELFPLDDWVFNTEAHPFRIVDIDPPGYSLPEKEPECWLWALLQFLWHWFKIIFIPYVQSNHGL